MKFTGKIKTCQPKIASGILSAKMNWKTKKDFT
jgi:hypothetical protein